MRADLRRNHPHSVFKFQFGCVRQTAHKEVTAYTVFLWPTIRKNFPYYSYKNLCCRGGQQIFFSIGDTITDRDE